MAGALKPVARGAAGLAAACAAALTICAPFVGGWEGRRSVAYRDLGGVPTICFGHTGPEVMVGDRTADARCDALLGDDLARHMAAAVACAPGLAARPRVLAAATSLAFNIGAGAFCRSTAARRFNAGDWRGGCDAFLMWDKVGGRAVPGLARRRAAERALCLGDGQVKGRRSPRSAGPRP